MLLSATPKQDALLILLASRSSILLATKNGGIVRANARSVDDADARIAYMRPSKRAAALWGDQQ